MVAPFGTLAQLGYDLGAGRVDSVAVVNHCLGRIAVMDKVGVGIGAVIEVAGDAVGVAASLDAMPRVGRLHRLPILLKDNIETADGMETTAGSLALLGAPRPVRDATIVRRLREAGMVMLGKTNLSEWANIRSPNSTSGWSARGGLTVNPHRRTHSASGSSSGSAAAVAAGFAPAAIGTETNGSIVSPASDCGIVGLKPTVGLVSRAGIIPITRWQDTAGPMTLTCWDAALLLNVLAGPDERDPMTEAAGSNRERDYAAGISRDALRGARLGVLRPECGRHAGVLALFEETCERLREAGATLVEVRELPNRKRSGALAWGAMLTELRVDLNLYLKGRGGRVGSLAELMAFNVAHRDREMRFFGQEFFEEAERRGTPEAMAAAVEMRAEAMRLAGPEGLDAVLRANDLDALICPTNDPAGVI
ncbi:MAG TPA: amidase family protein, partial [bacterium]|nr:amidase family protein [bacterium]